MSGFASDDDIILLDSPSPASPPQRQKPIATQSNEHGSGSSVPWQTKARAANGHTQSNNQSNNQSNKPSNNQPNSQTSRQLISQSNNHSNSQSSKQSNILSSTQSTNRSVSQSVNQSDHQPANHAVSRRPRADSIEIVDDDFVCETDSESFENRNESTYFPRSNSNNQTIKNTTVNPFQVKKSLFTSSSSSRSVAPYSASDLESMFKPASSSSTSVHTSSLSSLPSSSSSSSSLPSSSLPSSFNRPQMMSAAIAPPRILPSSVVPSSSSRKLPDVVTKPKGDDDDAELRWDPYLKRMVSKKKKKTKSSSSTSSSRSSGKRIVRINCQLVGESVMAISCVPALPQLLGVVMGIEGAAYDDKLSMWTLPISAHNAVVARLSGFSDDTTDIHIHEIDEKILTMKSSGRKGADQTDTRNLECMKQIPRLLQKRLYPFQREGVSFAVEHGGRILLADEMGLGKSLQSIAVCAYYVSSWPVLIICPSSLRLNWRNEIQRWLPNVRPRNIQVVLSGKDKLVSKGAYTTHFTIISYDLVHRLETQIKKQKYKFVIADESHYIKNASAKRTTALVPILKRADHCLLLSGTPALSRPSELYTQIDAITRGTVFGTMEDFGRRYCGASKGRYGEEFKGATNVQELNFLLKQHCMIRRLKDDVLTELRPKTRTAAMIAIDDKELEAQCKNMSGQLKSMASSLIQTDDKSAGAPSLSASARALTTDGNQGTLFDLYRRTGAAKLSGVIQYIGDLLEGGAKFLVFAHHLNVLDGIQAYLDKNKVDYFRLDGSTNAADRQAGVDRFQSTPECRVALLSITAGGTGITLTASSIVVFAELTWNPSLLMQAEDRVHRIGQANAVNCHYLIGNHSLDEVLWPLLVKKMNVVSSVLDGEEDELEFGEVKGDADAANLKFKRDTGDSHRAWEERERKKRLVEQNKLTMDRSDAIEIVSDDDEDDFESSRSRRETRSKTGVLKTDGKLDSYFQKKKPVSRIRDQVLLDDDEDDVVYKSESYASEYLNDEGSDLDGFLAGDDEEIEYVNDESGDDVLNDGSDDDWRRTTRSRGVLDEPDEIEDPDEDSAFQEIGWRSRKRVRSNIVDSDEAVYEIRPSPPNGRNTPPTPTSGSSLSSLPHVDRNAMYGDMYNINPQKLRDHDQITERQQMRDRNTKSRSSASSPPPEAQWLTEYELADLLDSMGFDSGAVAAAICSLEPCPNKVKGDTSKRYSVAAALDKLDQQANGAGVDEEGVKIPCDICHAEILFDDWKQHHQSCSKTFPSKSSMMRSIREADDDDEVDPVITAQRNRTKQRRRILDSDDEEDDNIKQSTHVQVKQRVAVPVEMEDDIENSPATAVAASDAPFDDPDFWFDD